MNIQFSTIIDLSQPIHESMPHWPGDPATKIIRKTTVAHDGYRLNQLTIGEHSGTHVGAPSHFARHGQTVDNISIQHFIAPGVKIDISAAARKHKDYLLTHKDVQQWEDRFGDIPANSWVIVQTGWSAYWDSPDVYLGREDDGHHFPGVSVQAAQFLLNKRQILGLGIDTHGVDGGLSRSFDVNLLLATRGKYHLENLTRLEKLNNRDFYLFIGALPLHNGNGSPCRILALQ